MIFRNVKAGLRSAFLSMSLPVLACGLHAQVASQQTVVQTENDSESTSNPNLTTLDWTTPTKYDTGGESALAMHSTGLIVEVHQSESSTNNTLWYHIGKLDRNTGKVSWGDGHSFIPEGDWPAVTMTKEGYVIITYSDGFYNCCSNLKYIVGTVDPNGDTKQLIKFKTNSKGTRFDIGFHDSISVNSLGVIVEAHQSGQGGDGIFWKVGRLTNPDAGDFTIFWVGRESGYRYDAGVDPKISVNDNNDVIEVHGVKGESKLHYIRGKVYFNQIIEFQSDHPRLESEGSRSNVVLLNNSSIIEVNRRSKGIVYRTGVLSGAAKVIWSEPHLIDGTKDHFSPAVAADATDAITTFRSSEEGGVFKSIYLRYSTAKLP
jgi:hypothetical protein